MLSIRLMRVGKKHQAIFRVVVLPSRSKPKGRFIENLGWFNPQSDKFELKRERILYWLSQGAKLSDTCHNLLVRAGILSGPKKPVHKIKKKKEGKSVAEEKPGPKEVEVKEEIKEKSEEKPAEKEKEKPEPEAGKIKEGEKIKGES